MGGVSVGVLDHFNIRTRNLAETVRFYEDVLAAAERIAPHLPATPSWS